MHGTFKTNACMDSERMHVDTWNAWHMSNECICLRMQTHLFTNANTFMHDTCICHECVYLFYDYVCVYIFVLWLHSCWERERERVYLVYHYVYTRHVYVLCACVHVKYTCCEARGGLLWLDLGLQSCLLTAQPPRPQCSYSHFQLIQDNDNVCM